MTAGAAGTIAWLRQQLHDVPEGDGWLSARERLVQDRLAVPKRRADWRLGRWTAKSALSAVLEVECMRVSVIAAADGAPEAFVDEMSVAVSLSISHRAGVGLAVVGQGVVVGGDLELIEPRSPAFVREWFTAVEQASISAIDRAGSRNERVCLLWSVKEAAAKVLREGLRLDPRDASVQLDGDREGHGVAGPWRGSAVTWAGEGRTLPGWWRLDDSMICSVASDAPSAAPVELS